MRRGGTTASADFRPTPPPLTGDSSAFRQAWVTDTSSGSPWIRQMTFAAQAPDLPMRMNEDGFVKLGPLTCPHRPCIGFLFGLSYRESGLAAWTRMRLTTILCQLPDTFAGFLPTARCLTAVALVSYLVDRSHSWYSAFLQTFVLVQGTSTPQVIRHDRRTQPLQQTGSALRFSAA